MNKFVVVFHSCFYSFLDNGCRIFSSDDQYLQDHPNMYTLLAEFDNIEDAQLFLSRQLCENELYILIRKENDILDYEVIINHIDADVHYSRFDFVAGPFSSWDELYNAYEYHNYESEPEKYLLTWE